MRGCAYRKWEPRAILDGSELEVGQVGPELLVARRLLELTIGLGRVVLSMQQVNTPARVWTNTTGRV
jgi:hypothetical protein